MASGFNRIPEFNDAMRAAIKKGLQKGILIVEREVKETMGSEKHGRTYRRGAITRKYKVGGKSWQKFKGANASFQGGTVKVITGYKFHRASAPGEAPAIDLGALVNSIHTQQDGDFKQTIYTNQAQAAALEFGRVDGHIAPRPFFRPAFTKKAAEIIAGIEDELKGIT